MSWLYLLLVLGVFAPGCGEPVLYQKFNKPMWATFIHLQDLKLGMTKSEVTGIMGEPGIREEGDYRGGHYTFYFYLTHDMDFEDSNTVRIGKRDYRQAVDRRDEGIFPGLPWEGVH
jgi:outer membrane protein assembly factor BamE (lipoprotein component of BamABCDE complex)